MSPTHTRHGNKLYRYYVSQSVLKLGAGACPIGRVPAGEIEAAVMDQLREILQAPEVIVGTWLAVRSEIDGLTEGEVRDALEGLDPLWDELSQRSRRGSFTSWSNASTSASTGWNCG